MEASVIKSKVETTWQDASAQWKDEYASRYRTAVITELENTLDRIRNTSEQLNETIGATLSSLQKFND